MTSGKEPPYPFVVEKDNKKVLIVHTSGYGKYMGHLDLIFDDSGDVISYGGNPRLMDHTVEQGMSK